VTDWTHELGTRDGSRGDQRLPGQETDDADTSDRGGGGKRRMSSGYATDACFSPRSMYRVNYYQATEAAGTSDRCGWAAASSNKGGKGHAT